MPLVSVLMPTFEHASFIRRAIDSLRAQTLTDWELIIIDDASPDETGVIIQPYLAELPAAVLAYSGVRHHYNQAALGQIEEYPLQLVQVMHRRTADYWLERVELVTDDLEWMFWSKLRPQGDFVGTGQVSCEWVDHPDQRHKLLREPVGGINPYRARFNLKQPLRFHTSVGNYIDEVEHYRRFCERPDTRPDPEGLKILLVGELAYNAERVLALEERGHRLYGLWLPDPYWYNTVGPLPFGHPEMRDWFETVVPGLSDPNRSLVLDGDLPKRDWFCGERSPRLSQSNEGCHTVVPGRPIGLHPHTVAELAEQDIHLHFYGDFTHGQWLTWIEKAKKLAPHHLHLHHQVDQENWLKEFSQYDAGWLHFFQSENEGELHRANWDDLNYPARLATLAVAGLPVLQRDNRDAIVATQTLARQLDLGLFFTTMAELREQLADEIRMAQVRENVWRQRELFTFDYHADRLINFFRHIANLRRKPIRKKVTQVQTRRLTAAPLIKNIGNLP